MKYRTAPLIALLGLGLTLAIVAGSSAQENPAVRLGASGQTLWDLNSGKVLLLTKSGPSLWDLDTGHAIQTFRGLLEKVGVGSVAFSPDGRLAITGSAGGYCEGATPCPANPAVLWDVATGNQLRRLDATPTFSPDGARLLTGTGVWDTQSGQKLFILPASTHTVFSRNGSTITGLVTDRRGRVWDAATGKEKCTVDAENGSTWSGFFWSADSSPDGKYILLVSANGVAQTWDTGTCRLAARFGGHTSHVSNAQFSADGEKVITSSGDQSVRLWDAASGRELRRFEHRGGGGKFVLSPDMQRLLTWWQYPANSKPCVSLWNVESGGEIHQFCPADGFVDFSPDGKSILILNGNKPELWSAVTGELTREYPQLN
jgi:dipeptidyl aminopeptidase/acylaminoacyl peptidase